MTTPLAVTVKIITNKNLNVYKDDSSSVVVLWYIWDLSIAESGNDSNTMNMKDIIEIVPQK